MTVWHCTEQVKQAIASKTVVRIAAVTANAFWLLTWRGNCYTRRHSGITNYEPGELVLSARAGRPLAEIETALAAENKMLGFEPPYFGETATLGGTLACIYPVRAALMPCGTGFCLKHALAQRLR